MRIDGIWWYNNDTGWLREQGRRSEKTEKYESLSASRRVDNINTCGRKSGLRENREYQRMRRHVAAASRGCERIYFDHVWHSHWVFICVRHDVYTYQLHDGDDGSFGRSRREEKSICSRTRPFKSFQLGSAEVLLPCAAYAGLSSVHTFFRPHHRPPLYLYAADERAVSPSARAEDGRAPGGFSAERAQLACMRVRTPFA